MSGNDDALIELGRKLIEADRYWVGLPSTATGDGATVEELEALQDEAYAKIKQVADAIIATPAHSLAGLLVKLLVVSWCADYPAKTIASTDTEDRALRSIFGDVHHRLSPPDFTIITPSGAAAAKVEG